MEKIFWFAIILSIAACVAVAACSPALINENAFLNGFVNHEILSIQAVIFTITLASIANIHLEYNKLHERHPELLGRLQSARSELKNNAVWLILIFAVTVVLLILRSSPWTGYAAQAFLTGLILVGLLFNILVLSDITMSIFSIKPTKKS